ncbi:hypothetical protein [Georgenia sp. TF02-10]|nr:hypothetical protein [Georgenia sp. TF02-10]
MKRRDPSYVIGQVLAALVIVMLAVVALGVLVWAAQGIWGAVIGR